MPVVFPNQTGLFLANWCKVELKSYSLEHIDSSLQKESSRYVDGLGYDSYRNKRIMFEGSSGQSSSCVNKTIDDSTKQISSLIAMLKRIANKHLNSSYGTLLKTKVYGIQSVQTTLILSELKYDEDVKFSYKEVRLAQIPTTFAERNKWVKILKSYVIFL